MTKKSVALFSLAFAILLPGYIHAQSIGGGGGGPTGGEVKAIAIDPANAATLYIGTSDSGIFKTTDGGMHWVPASVGLGRSSVTEIAVDTSDSSVIYAATSDGLFKSTNRAGSWVNVRPERYGVYDLLIAGATSSRVYASVSGGLFKSRDGGATWKQIEFAQPRTATGLPGFETIGLLAVDPSNPDAIYANIGRSTNVIVRDGWKPPGIYRTTDDGKSWTRMFDEIVPRLAVKLVFVRENPQVIYIVASRRLFKSTDGGQNWETVAEDFTSGMRVAEFIVSPSNPDVLYVGIAPPISDGGVGFFVFFTTLTGGAVLRSADGGKTWSSVTGGFFNSAVKGVVIDWTDPSTLYVASRNGVNKSTNGGTSWTLNNSGLPQLGVYQLTLDPTESETIFASTGAGVFKSTNGGMDWFPLGPRGAEASGSTVLAINRKNPRELFVAVGFNVRELYRSLDGGQNWDALKSVLPPHTVIPEGIYSVVMDPSNLAVLYAGTSYGVYKTEDKGELWYRASPSFRDIDALAIDPSNSQFVYAAAEGRGVFRSDDGGDTWSFANEGLPSPTAARAHALVVDPNNDKTIYAVMQELYVSHDEGRSWLPLVRNFGPHRVTSLAIDSSNGTLFVGTNGEGVFTSTDNGETWTNISAGLTNPAVLTLAIDPRQHATMYAGTGGGIFKSVDAGRTWQSTGSK